MVEAKVFEEGTLSGGEMASLLLTENGNRSENPVVEMRAVQALVRQLVSAGAEDCEEAGARPGQASQAFGRNRG